MDITITATLLGGMSDSARNGRKSVQNDHLGKADIHFPQNPSREHVVPSNPDDIKQNKMV